MKLLYEDLSAKIIGAMFKVYNELGYGYQEKEYGNGLAEEFKIVGLSYKRELCAQLYYAEKLIRRYFLDFLVEDKVVVELKVANQIYKQHFTQVIQYLQKNNIKLGLILAITPSGVLVKRVINERSV
ncbi:MAG: GxxExxY protein [Candidatus Doudnabacteria bacterium]|nr:GxxExxY protein [Candidatus Doudnabacteria bacterium]